MAPSSFNNEIIDLLSQKPENNGKPPKPSMRFDARSVQDSSLAQSLPGFLERLARANQEMDTEGSAAGFELTEEEASSQRHIEIDLYAGVLQAAQQRRLSSRVKLPSGGSFPVSADEEDEEDEHVSESDVSQSEANNDEAGSSSDESQASSSTETSQPANKKRKMAPLSDSEPGVQRRHGKVRVTSPALSARSAGSSSSSGSSIGSTRIIKIKVPPKSPSQADDSDGSVSSSTPQRKIIELRDPRNSPPSSSSRSASRQSTPSSVIRLRVPDLSPSRAPAASRGGERPRPRRTSSDTDSSSSSTGFRIKLISSERIGTAEGSQKGES